MTYDDLALQWDLTIDHAKEILRKFEKLEYISVLQPPLNKQGTLICLKGYLALTFHISDLLIDRNDLPLSLRVRVDLPGNLPVNNPPPLNDKQHTSIPKELTSKAYKQQYEIIIQKVADILSLQGVKCSRCPKACYRLELDAVDLSEFFYTNHHESENSLVGRKMILTVFCSNNSKLLSFELILFEEEPHGNFN